MGVPNADIEVENRCSGRRLDVRTLVDSGSVVFSLPLALNYQVSVCAGTTKSIYQCL
jgi:hypothetical protein